MLIALFKVSSGMITVILKKHRLRTYVEQPADEYQGEYDKCMARVMHRSNNQIC
jgi:hypothetical protein